MRGNKCTLAHGRCSEKPSVHASAALTEKKNLLSRFGTCVSARGSHRLLLLAFVCRRVQEGARVEGKSCWREGERPARHAVTAADTNTGPQFSSVSCSCWSHWCNVHHQPEGSKSLKWPSVNSTGKESYVGYFEFGAVYLVWIHLSKYPSSPPNGVPVVSGLVSTQCFCLCKQEADRRARCKMMVGKGLWCSCRGSSHRLKKLQPCCAAFLVQTLAAFILVGFPFISRHF